ncbi:MAG: carbonate dehydratase [Pseudomonadales bacterium]
MKKLSHLFASNRAWADRVSSNNPGFFETLAERQTPEYLWIGCADSRVPANEIVDLLPGDVFVHRNVSNLVIHTDMNCLSVLQYAVEVLKVKHIMVVGHYGCGGVKASIADEPHGLIDNWLRHIRDIYNKHKLLLSKWQDDVQLDRLCEINVVEQANNVCNTTVVREAWARGQDLTVHSWVYGLHNGLIEDLCFTVNGSDNAEAVFDEAIEKIAAYEGPAHVHTDSCNHD